MTNKLVSNSLDLRKQYANDDDDGWETESDYVNTNNIDNSKQTQKKEPEVRAIDAGRVLLANNAPRDKVPTIASKTVSQPLPKNTVHYGGGGSGNAPAPTSAPVSKPAVSKPAPVSKPAAAPVSAPKPAPVNPVPVSAPKPAPAKFVPKAFTPSYDEPEPVQSKPTPPPAAKFSAPTPPPVKAAPATAPKPAPKPIQSKFVEQDTAPPVKAAPPVPAKKPAPPPPKRVVEPEPEPEPQYDQSYDQSYDQGYDQSYDQSYDNQGYDQSYDNQGYDDQQGYDQSYDNQGYDDQQGYDQSYDNQGYDDQQQGEDYSQYQKAEALYDYAAQQEGDISFYAGDIIYVHDSSSDWWVGECEAAPGFTGSFPSTFVRLV